MKINSDILTEKHKNEISDILALTFRNKLKPFLGEFKKANKFLRISLDYNQCISIKEDNRIKGVLFFKDKYSDVTDISLLKILLNFPLKIFKLILLDLLFASNLKEGVLSVDMLAVDSTSRSKGYGRILMLEIIDYAMKNNYSSIELNVTESNIRGMKFYESLGFEEFEKVKIHSKLEKYDLGGFHGYRLDIKKLNH